MASRSPVIINTSSPASIRLPTVTPPSLGKSSRKASSSSSGLPSPSTFVKPRAPGLQSGSHAQAIPSGAFGFATAGSLWRDNKFEHTVPEVASIGKPSIRDRRASAERNGQDGGIPKRADATSARSRGTNEAQKDGKLKRPKKALATARKDGPEIEHGQDLEFPRDMKEQPGKITKAKPVRSNKSQDKSVAVSSKTTVLRRPSVDLSEFAFGVYDLGMQTQAPVPATKLKKPRKKVEKAEKVTKINKELPATKPRSKKFKSEAVILDSDDPLAEGEPALEPKTIAKRKPGIKKPAKSIIPEERHAEPVEGQTIAALQSVGEATAAAETSLYFAGNAPTADSAETTAVVLDQPESAIEPNESIDAEAQDLVKPAHPMVLTPVKEISTKNNTARVATPDADSPKVQLTDIIGNFGYVAEDTAVSGERNPTGEPVTKRRRIELAESVITMPAARKAALTTEAEVPKAKKPAGRKKPQTITALATSAYQPVAETNIEQSTVSEFFAPRTETVVVDKAVETIITKPKKPRKSRKKADAAEGDETAPAKPKRAKKAAKVKFNEADHKPKLYSPARATAQMKQQDFLFGTSSQLAVDEPATFIRDMQAAVEASEMDSVPTEGNMYGSQTADTMASQLLTTPRKHKSCVKVPTAPHGTNLSLQQAHRELWCVASRDKKGDLLKDSRSGHQETGMDAASTTRDTTEPSNSTRPLGPDPALETILDLPGVPLAAVPEPAEQTECDVALPRDQCDAEATNKHSEQIVVDLSGTSPIADTTRDDSGIALGDLLDKDPPLKSQSHKTQDMTNDKDDKAVDDDTWMLIQSDSPVPIPFSAGETVGQAVRVAPLRTAATLQRDVSPTRTRTVLQPLDANIGPSARALSVDARSKSDAALLNVSDLAIKKPRGRPRKTSATDESVPVPPKKRGRPPKRPAVTSDPSPEAAKFKKPRLLATTGSQQAPSKTDWLDVDEISDSDSPVTPSPPRRRATSSPPAIPPLQITVDGSPLANLKDKAPAIVASASSFKPGEPQWPAIRAAVFPKIASNIKNAPRSTDSGTLTWYEKILMYDPIVLEELTAYLNEQGLSFESQKQKPKPKKKGRKKKDAPVEELEVEWETVQEPLQAWMVQKWCESNSICCVWAGGGWSGRARH